MNQTDKGLKILNFLAQLETELAETKTLLQNILGSTKIDPLIVADLTLLRRHLNHIDYYTTDTMNYVQTYLIDMALNNRKNARKQRKINDDRIIEDAEDMHEKMELFRAGKIPNPLLHSSLNADTSSPSDITPPLDIDPDLNVGSTELDEMRASVKKTMDRLKNNS